MSKVTPGGSADRDGRLKVGDRIMSVSKVLCVCACVCVCVCVYVCVCVCVCVCVSE